MEFFCIFFSSIAVEEKRILVLDRDTSVYYPEFHHNEVQLDGILPRCAHTHSHTHIHTYPGSVRLPYDDLLVRARTSDYEK